MELFISGVKLSPLGSYKDRVMREFLNKRALKEVYKHKVIALSGIGASAMLQNPKQLVDQIFEAFDNYSNMEIYLENVKQELETSMREEYEFWKDSRPKVNISKDGKASLSVSSMIPSKPTKSKRKK
jgi:hypothetical protein